MPKTPLAGLSTREATPEDIRSIAEVLTAAPDDGVLYRYPNIPKYPEYMTAMYERMLRSSFSNTATLMRVAVVPDGSGPKVVGISSWIGRVPDPALPGRTRDREFRPATLFNTVNRGLIITGLIFHYLYGLVFPNPAMRGIPQRVKALQSCKQLPRALITSTPAYELSGLYVHPDYQGYGVGKLLVRWGMDRAAEEGIPVFISAEERGVRFYEAVGCKRLSKSDYWLNSEGELIAPEDRAKNAWEKANGGVSGCDLIWCPEGVAFDEHQELI